MDWAGCELVESIPGKMSGRPVLRGTRVPADAILGNFEAGSPIEEIAENYPGVAEADIRALLSFAGQHRQQAVR